MKNPLSKVAETKNLSKRELEIFEALLTGISNKEIASLLGISQKTVEEHLTSLYSKIGLDQEQRPYCGELNNPGISLIEKAQGIVKLHNSHIYKFQNKGERCAEKILSSS